MTSSPGMRAGLDLASRKVGQEYDGVVDHLALHEKDRSGERRGHGGPVAKT